MCIPVMLRKFDSGAMVIQNKSHSDEEVLVVLYTALDPILIHLMRSFRGHIGYETGITASDAALTLKIAPALAKEHLLTAETKGNTNHLVET
ncbi:hypothetical protein Bca52824_050607 [Brassica carinata]|uniref:Vacuolar protein-sorting-associated protein 36 n=1 Tax=Brassica carinata TaxID=52824 RepID=A0A8X7R0T2_BRACI|nr:hypothetical protein Bca52824_050607 [Brassica carinata]